MAVVAQHFKVFKLVVQNRIRLALDVQRGVGKRRAAQLQLHLFVVVAVNMAIAPGPDEITHVQVALLRHHVGQQGVAGDVEGHAQKNIGTALVQLAAQFAFALWRLCGCYIELKKRVARHQRHLVQLGHVPAAHDNAAAVGVGLQGFDDVGNLIDMAAIWRGPTAPLHAVHRAQVARLGIRPLVPNAHAAFLEPVVVGRASQEPQQLLDDAAQVHLLGGHQREAFVQIKTHLVAKHALGAGAGAIGLVWPSVSAGAT